MSKQEAKQEKAIVMETPMFINTKWAAVAVYGWNLISGKVLETMGILLNLPFWNEGDHGIRSIHIGELGLCRWDDETDTEYLYPLAECWPNAGAVGIDLKNVFDKTLVRCQKDAPNASIFGWFLQSLFLNLLHEAHHTAMWHADGVTAEDHKTSEEEAAEKFAHDALMDVAKQFAIEPEEWIDEPWFRDMVLGEGLEAVANEDWVAAQLHMLDNRLFYHLPESDEGPAIKCHTFKDFLHLCISNDEPNDETWLGTPIPVAPIAKAAAVISPEAPVTEAVEAMVEQAANLQPAEATPAEDVVVLPAGPVEPVADVINDPARDAAALETYEQQTQPSPEVAAVMDDSEIMEDMEEPVDMEMEADEANLQQLMDAPLPQQQPTVAAAIQQEYSPQQQFVTGTQPASSVVDSSPVVNHYNPTSMDDNTLVNVIQGLYFKCYNHIFSYCGQTNTGFSHPSKVYELQLELTPEEAEAVVSMDCLDPNGRWCPRTPAKVQGMDNTVTARLLGAETKNTKLPYYKLYLNANGQEACRMLLPQNPLKQNNGQFSKPALAAQSGSRIMYVFEGNDEIARATGKKVIGKIVDNRWEA